MLARQRQEHILERVAATGGIRVADVVEELGISEMTVRRDITELVAQGLVERVHGGAVAAGPTTIEPRFTAKSTLNLDAKRRIGQAAAAMVRPGDSLALSAGTTTLALAQALTEMEHFPTLTVITNSLPAAQVLFDAADAARSENRDAPTVVVTGGERTAVDAVLADRRLARLLPLVVDRLLDVPDPRQKVLLAAPEQFRAVRVVVSP